MLDKFPGGPLLGWLHPDNSPFCLEWSMRGMQRKFDHDIWGKSEREMEQETTATEIARPPAEDRTLWISKTFLLACYGDFQWQADPGLTHLALREKQSPKSPFLFESDAHEGNTVPDASPHGICLTGPDHSCLNVEGALVCLQTHKEGYLLSEELGQLNTGPTHSYVAAPPHSYLAAP